MVALVIDSPEKGFEFFVAAMNGTIDLSNIDDIELGDWVNPQIRVPQGQSEITAPFMEAFLTSQTALYRLVAELKYGDGDVRHLTPDDLDAFQIKVQVTAGSSNYKEELAKTLGQIGLKAVESLSPNQKVSLIVGLALLLSGSYGVPAYLEHRKTVRLAELQSTERQQYVSALQFASASQAQTVQAVVGLLQNQGGVSARAVQTAADVNAAKLKAATSVPEVEINGTHITQGEAKELRANTRRRSTRLIVEREMRVIEINTSAETNTIVAVEEVGTGKQYRVSFADLLIQDRDLQKLFESLQKRENIWLRLDVKEVGSEIKSVEILGVVEPPGDGTRTASR